MGLCRQQEYGLQETAKAFRRKDHTTVMHAEKNFAWLMTQNGWKEKIESLMRKIKNE